VTVLQTQLVELQAQRIATEQRRLGLAAISYDSPETLKEFATRRGITFRSYPTKGRT
jgi:peroxiredoxin